MKKLIVADRETVRMIARAARTFAKELGEHPGVYYDSWKGGPGYLIIKASEELIGSLKVIASQLLPEGSYRVNQVQFSRWKWRIRIRYR